MAPVAIVPMITDTFLNMALSHKLKMYGPNKGR